MFIQYEVWSEDGEDIILATASLKEAKQYRQETPGAYIVYEDLDTGEIIQVP